MQLNEWVKRMQVEKLMEEEVQQPESYTSLA
jgi:hypothetical protein